MSEQVERAGDALMAAAKSLANAWETDTPARVIWAEWAKVQPAIDAWMAARRAEPAPVDWPARFRAAAEVADDNRLDGDMFRMFANDLEHWPAARVAVIGRALARCPEQIPE